MQEPLSTRVHHPPGLTSEKKALVCFSAIKISVKLCISGLFFFSFHPSKIYLQIIILGDLVGMEGGGGGGGGE